MLAWGRTWICNACLICTRRLSSPVSARAHSAPADFQATLPPSAHPPPSWTPPRARNQRGQQKRLACRRDAGAWRALASRTFCTRPVQTQPRTHQHLPRDFTGLDVKRAATMKIVRIQQSAVHVGATAYLAREERAVDAARLLVVVNGGIKDLASGQTRSATRTQHPDAAAPGPRLPTAVPAARGFAGRSLAERLHLRVCCACDVDAAAFCRRGSHAGASNQDRRGSTAPTILFLPNPLSSLPLLPVLLAGL